MATLAQRLFFRPGENTGEEQLLRLFWSRATLKKQFDKQRNENFALGERLKQEEMLKLRLQQRFEQLESILANPATAASAITYYQLRDLWHRCNLRVITVSSELRKAHHDVEYRKHVGQFRRYLYRSLSIIQRELHEVNHQGEALNQQILNLREQRSNCQGFWRFFRRRALTVEINAKRSERRAITLRLGELTEQLQASSAAQPPEFGGLSVDIKRAINLAVIACAQELYLYFADRQLVSLAREASARPLTDVAYGDAQACRELGRYLEERLHALHADSEFQSRVEKRTAHLATAADYCRLADTLPKAESVAGIALLNESGQTTGQVDVNVLADGCWDLCDAILS